ncbi:globin-1-like isoform X2 [Galleria mellonella]|uniref:Globin-1-like isoform X2 n=1 Tax=Galleria mellonella TaxID=7137 RepID=A0A6J1WZ88_GALME|nr:globin-1-like isoform X2 [Galleria mellonella]
MIGIGGLINNLWWGGNPDEVHPITGLSRRDVYAIQRSWSQLYSNPGKYGLLLFIKLFRADPETKSFFKAIQNIGEDEISKSFQFRAHAINLMTAINAAVVSLDQPEVVIVLMNKLGESHHRRHVEIKHFKVVKSVLVNILKTELKANQALVTSWDRFVDFIYKHIFEKLNSLTN